jgi:hypothetical protein
MSSDMNRQRFAALAEAFGADLRRWPEAERDAARAFREAQPAVAEPLLAEAGRLDFILEEGFAAAQPSAALRDRILASAPRARRPLFSLGRFRAAAPWLAPGAGMAAACAAGAWLGVTASHTAETRLRADTVLVASADLSAADAEDAGGL